MIIHPWDEAGSDAERRTWLSEGRQFGTLIANGPEGGCPDVVPTESFSVTVRDGS